MVDNTCSLCVDDHKLYCTTHDDYPPIGKWEEHEDRTIHDIKTLPFRHVLYIGAYCNTCNDNHVLVDEEQ